LSPPFRLFKKKDDVVEEKKDIDSRSQLRNTTNSLTVSDALILLQNIESERIKGLANDLSPIKESVVKSLRSIERVANNLDIEDIKLEEARFKSIVENSKRTVVSSLRREASSDIPGLQSIHEVKKFEEKLESIIDRFGEVSGSHSRVMNVFMKKYAGKLKGEFETLSSLLKQTKSVMSEFEEENSVTVKSIDLLNICSQKITSKKANEDKIKDTYREIETLKYDLHELKSQLSRVENSTQFKESYRNLEQIGVLEKEKQEFQRKVSDLYSHVSRAFTKYSYGMTKDTLGRLKVLTEEPWRIFEDAEVSSYASLLIEIQKAVKSGKIKLKDSERIMNYMEIILKSLPEHHDEIRIINLKLNELRENKNGVVVNRSEELKNDIRNCKNRLGDLEQLVDQLKKQLTENNSECEHLVKQIDDYILQITGKKYFVTT
jgi:hypothetical protein